MLTERRAYTWLPCSVYSISPIIHIVLSGPQTIRAYHVFCACSQASGNAQGTRPRSLGQTRCSGPLFSSRPSTHERELICSRSPDVEEDIVYNGEQPGTD